MEMTFPTSKLRGCLKLPGKTWLFTQIEDRYFFICKRQKLLMYTCSCILKQAKIIFTCYNFEDCDSASYFDNGWIQHVHNLLLHRRELEFHRWLGYCNWVQIQEFLYQ